MATKPTELRMSLAEFLQWDDGTDTRYELIAGRVVAMAVPAARHGALTARLARIIGPTPSRRRGRSMSQPASFPAKARTPGFRPTSR